MDAELFLFGVPDGGRVWHVVPTMPTYNIIRARCGLRPLHGWARFSSSLDDDWPRCRRCFERQGPMP